MRRFGELVRQVLAREVLLLVQPAPPVGAAGDIINDAGRRHPHARATLAAAAAQLPLADSALGLYRRVDQDLNRGRCPRAMMCVHSAGSPSVNTAACATT